MSLALYDPLEHVSDIHGNMRTRYATAAATGAKTTEAIMVYLQSFLATDYAMAPALINAKTLNSIDHARCMDANVNDVCDLKYWLVGGLGGTDNRDFILNDQLSASNNPSALDCGPSETVTARNYMDSARDRPEQKWTQRYEKFQVRWCMMSFLLCLCF